MKRVLILTTAMLLGACAAFTQGTEFTKARILNYCTTTSPEARELLRQQLVYSDGSPMIQVYCEPHGTPSVTTQPPDVDEGSPGWFGV